MSEGFWIAVLTFLAAVLGVITIIFKNRAAQTAKRPERLHVNVHVKTVQQQHQQSKKSRGFRHRRQQHQKQGGQGPQLHKSSSSARSRVPLIALLLLGLAAALFIGASVGPLWK